MYKSVWLRFIPSVQEQYVTESLCSVSDQARALPRLYTIVLAFYWDLSVTMTIPFSIGLLSKFREKCFRILTGIVLNL